MSMGVSGVEVRRERRREGSKDKVQSSKEAPRTNLPTRGGGMAAKNAKRRKKGK
jgi:hypothetical protein